MEKVHFLIIECSDGNQYESEAASKEEAIAMLGQAFIPCYQDVEPNEYMLLSTMEVERVYVKIMDKGELKEWKSME
jgi:hypothetical protein